MEREVEAPPAFGNGVENRLQLPRLFNVTGHHDGAVQGRGERPDKRLGFLI